MRKLIAVGVVLVALSASPVQAQDPVIGPQDDDLICDAGFVIDCSAEGECTTGSPESVDLPRFLQLDLTAMELTSPSPGFDGEATPLGGVDRVAGRIVINGHGRAGRVFSLSIHEGTGAMRASVLADEFAFLVFGGCVPLTLE